MAFPKNCIGKSVSDQAKGHAKPEGKDNKPVFLIKLAAKLKPNRIILKARNGQTVSISSVCQRWDQENPHKQLGWRYYFPEWGMDIAEKAIRIQGSGLCEVWADGKKIGEWNPAFRDGEEKK